MTSSAPHIAAEIPTTPWPEPSHKTQHQGHDRQVLQGPCSSRRCRVVTQFQHRFPPKAVRVPVDVLGKHQRAVPDANGRLNCVRVGGYVRVLLQIQRRAVDEKTIARLQPGRSGPAGSACRAEVYARKQGARQREEGGRGGLGSRRGRHATRDGGKAQAMH